MAVWRMLALLAASKQWYCIGFKQDSIDAADLFAWLNHSSIVQYRHGMAWHGITPTSMVVSALWRVSICLDAENPMALCK